jgi:hypothetical protein
MALSDIDFVHLMFVTLGLAENFAMPVLQVDPRYRKSIKLGTAAKVKGDRIADRNPVRQANVVIGLTGGRDKPTAAFRQHSRSPRSDGFNVTSWGLAETKDKEQNRRHPSRAAHRRLPI